MRRALGIASLTLAGAWAAACPAAMAYVAPGATVISASLERQELADDLSTQVALSGDGRFAFFTTRARNFYADDDADPAGRFRVGGIFRRDLVTGALAVVAHGEVRTEAAPDEVATRGALNPSASEDGRYVAFSTGAQLVPQDTNGNIDVYVRDMAIDWREPGAYELISRTSTGAPARYAALPEGQSRPGIDPGAEVSARAAISADGRMVVFRTADIVSDLPSGAAVDTPGAQVFVRDRIAGTTRLVTRRTADRTPAGGAVGAAVISGDGSTVVWVGRNAAEQTAFVAGEGENPAFEYYLWQRIADGDTAPTRRITGLADPEDPGCAPGTPIIDSPSLTGPCYGPLGQFDGHLGGIVAQTPSLSFDGRRVLYFTNATPRGLSSAGNATDAFIVDVQPGGARKPTTIELTRDGGATSATNAGIDGGMLSADGRWVLLITARTSQVTQLLRPVGAPRAVAGPRELALIDLANRTIERIGLAAGGTDPNGSAGPAPAIDAVGRRLAFTSGASNLFFGDANNRPDAFVVTREDAPPPESLPGEPSEQAPIIDGGTEGAEPGRITVRVRKASGDRVTLQVTLPEGGSGRIDARGKLRNAKGKRIGATRSLARASVRAASAQALTVTLRASASARASLRAAGKLTASARLTFTSTSGRSYVGRVSVAFRQR